MSKRGYLILLMKITKELTTEPPPAYGPVLHQNVSQVDLDLTKRQYSPEQKLSATMLYKTK